MCMIKGVFWLYFLLVSVFLIGGVSADEQCDDDQTILRLFSNSNSHASLWSDTNAQIAVCYENIFGGKYTGREPHQCSAANGNKPSNFVVSLTSNNNAHVNKDYSDNGINICYGDLACSVKSQCSLNEREIMVLSSESNAHVDIGAGNNLKVCCSSAREPRNIVYWANGRGQRIASSNKGKTVWLIARTSFPANTEVKFEIKERDSINDDDILVGNDALSANTEVGGLAKVSWTITDNDIEKAKSAINDEDKEKDEVEFYFEARATGFNKESMNLIVNINPSVSPPIACIGKPEHRQIYFKDQDIVFESCSTDSDGLIEETKWIIEEEPNAQVADNKYKFASPGQKTITLKVTDDGGQSAEAQIAILIIGKTSNGLLAFIEKPRHKEIVNGASRRVSFSAKDSYVIKNGVGEQCNGVIDCVVGNCPVRTMNECPGGSNPLVKKEVIGGNIGFDSMKFIWEFDDGYSFEGTGASAVEGNKPYSSFSQEQNDKWIKLTASIGNPFTLNKETRRVFTFVGNEQCLLNEEGGVFVKIDDAGFVREKKKINEGGCVGEDGVASGGDIGNPVNVRGDDCCPAGTFCRAGLGTNGISAGCSDPGFTNVRSCGDYKTINECEDDPFRVGDEDSMNPEVTENPKCGTRENGGEWLCEGCIWKQNENKCVLKKVHSLLPVSPRIAPTNCNEPLCLVSSNNEDLTCDENGYFTIVIKKEFQSGTCTSATLDSCVNSEVRVPCRGNLQFPFFGIFNFIATLVAIAFIYRIKKVYMNSACF